MQDSGGMMDIGGKNVTVRFARAEGRIFLGAEAYEALKQGTCPKGDVLATARVAAVQAVKSTPAMIPMCHTILVESVQVDFALDATTRSVQVFVAVRSSGKTGVEMEALCAVSVACLTVYDMLKYAGPGMTVERIRLMEKSGGRSGHYRRAN
jgi:cyclic pyranopterin phosphate synthase